MILIYIAVEILSEILPERLWAELKKLPTDNIYELRLRSCSPAVVCVAGRNVPLPDISVSRTELDNIIHRACDYAIYAVNDQICRGFITIRGGVRIGLVGEVVTDGNGGVSTIKNITALCIRIPHQIKDCAVPLLPFIFGNRCPYKTLIIAPPGAGKTTILRDIAVQISARFPLLNTLVLDERGEIAANYLGDNQLLVGAFTDVVTGGSKRFGFENGIRSMRPDVIITDEIAADDGADLLKTAARSGVVIIASVHAADLDEIREKPAFREIIAERIFDRYVVLAGQPHVGTVAGVYDRDLHIMH